MNLTRTVQASFIATSLFVGPAKTGRKTRLFRGVVVGVAGYLFTTTASIAAGNAWNDFADAMQGVWGLKKAGDSVADYSDRTQAVVAAVGRQIGVVSAWQACSKAQGIERKSFWEAHLQDNIVFPSEIELDAEIVRCCDPNVIYAAPGVDILSAVLPTDVLGTLAPTGKDLGRSVMPIEMALALAEHVFTEPVFERAKATIVANAEASSDYVQCKPLIRMMSDLD